MAFDTSTRNKLQRMVAACRDLLTKEFEEQLQERFGIYPGDGRVLEIERLPVRDDETVAVARLLRARIEHLMAGNALSLPDAVRRVLREQAFTVLNRFAALRMAEERGIIPESIAGGMTSKGAQVFADLAGPGLGGAYDRYRIYLDRLLDELALDLRVLFDRFSPLGLLFPCENTLTELLRAINTPDLARVWAADETIGWIYQYFNDPEERKKMRKDSAAPRNSRELAVRNQFFTPRYVVEFLSDNTLGRLWYEMCKGKTRLAEQCRYMVRRPTEIFLQPGETPDGGTVSTPSDSETLSQEELLRQPVHVPHRALKDPREIRMIDPACGSMHFGLYAFDLYLVIYEEAWDMTRTGKIPDGADESISAFSLYLSAFSSKEEFLRDVPRLIIEHNIHGVDIDPRAVQIAGLSLWLRAQRAWKEQNIAPLERPTIKKSNIVCAEPMPGDTKLLGEFADSLQPRFLGQIVRQVWDSMQLAGEAGSLLKIEEEIAEWVKEAKRQWITMPKDEQFSLFESLGRYGKKQEELNLDLTGITDAAFWEEAEERIYDALREFTVSVEDATYQRRLFVDDAARGFAFIDLCRQRYDVALMNPPFGDASIPSRAYIEDTYGDTKGDVYKAFVECFHARLIPAGFLGIISSRTGFFLGQSEDWRTRVVLRLFRPLVLADLGSGVLDAMVEVAAYVLRSLSAPEARNLTLSIVPVLGKVVRDSQDRFSLPKWQAARGDLKRHQAVAELEHLEAHGFIQRSSGNTVRYTPLWHLVKKVTAPQEPVFPPLVCVRAINEDAKGEVLIRAGAGRDSRNLFISSVNEFRRFPGATFSYWATPGLRRVFREFAPFEGNGRTARRGPSSGDDFRRVRLWVEIPPRCVGRTEGWVPFAKGGKHNPFYSDVHLLVAWEERRMTFHGFFGRPGRMIARVESVDRFFQFGLTWPIKNRFSFKPWPLPAGCVFAHVGPSAFFPDRTATAVAWGLMSSAPFTALARITAGWNFEAGVIQQTPVPDMGSRQAQPLAVLSQRAWATQRTLDDVNSVSHAFVLPAFLGTTGNTLAERAAAWAARMRMSEETVGAIQAEIDDLAFRLYGLDAADRAALTSTEVTAHADAAAEVGEDEEEESVIADAPALAADLLAYAVGCTFGRWDIRYATGERPAPPAPDPFAPLPVCPPGMLQNAASLPATPGDVPAGYPVRITWPGLLVDDPAHPEDIERRVREVLAVLFPGRADAIADEACSLIGIKSLHEWFRKPAGFFADHLKRYSKSRRQAPIYWPLSTASGRYTLWIYYHRLTEQTLFECVTGFVKPKIEEVESDLTRLRNDQAPRQQIDDMVEFLAELTTFRDELLRITALPWKPNLNDGVLITASPLWKLFRLPKWQKDLKACWQALEKGEYDWAHLAYTIWSDRVKKACETDRSLAIAHGLENLCKTEAPKAKRKRGKKAEKQLTEGLLEE